MWGHVVLLLARLISYVGNIFQSPAGNIYAWADSSVVPSWLCRNPQRFKAFVGNCLSEVIELISPNCWQQVKGADNPADSVSRGIIPAEEIKNDLWWEGPQWLRLSESTWPEQPPQLDKPEPLEEKDDESKLVLNAIEEKPSILERLFNYTRLKRVTAWIFHVVHNCGRNPSQRTLGDALTTEELQCAQRCWI